MPQVLAWGRWYNSNLPHLCAVHGFCGILGSAPKFQTWCEFPSTIRGARQRSYAVWITPKLLVGALVAYGWRKCTPSFLQPLEESGISLCCWKQCSLQGTLNSGGNCGDTMMSGESRMGEGQPVGGLDQGRDGARIRHLGWIPACVPDLVSPTQAMCICASKIWVAPWGWLGLYSGWEDRGHLTQSCTRVTS